VRRLLAEGVGSRAAACRVRLDRTQRERRLLLPIRERRIDLAHPTKAELLDERAESLSKRIPVCPLGRRQSLGDLMRCERLHLRA
jgi:hypothetical protein